MAADANFLLFQLSPSLEYPSACVELTVIQKEPDHTTLTQAPGIGVARDVHVNPSVEVRIFTVFEPATKREPFQAMFRTRSVTPLVRPVQVTPSGEDAMLFPP